MRYRNRKEAAAYIQECGLNSTEKTLAKLACIGGGPVYQKFGSRAVYTDAALDAWIEAKLSPPMHSTTDRKSA